MSLAFRCPLCDRAFQVAAEHRGQAVFCPHCQMKVAIPSAAAERWAGDAPPEPPPGPNEVAGELRPVGPEPEVQVRDPKTRVVRLAGQHFEVRSLSAEERAAFRRRVNLVIFGVTATLLGLIVVGLLWWGG